MIIKHSRVQIRTSGRSTVRPLPERRDVEGCAQTDTVRNEPPLRSPNPRVQRTGSVWNFCRLLLCAAGAVWGLKTYNYATIDKLSDTFPSKVKKNTFWVETSFIVTSCMVLPKPWSHTTTKERANKKTFSQRTVTIRAQLLRGKGSSMEPQGVVTWKAFITRKTGCRLTFKSLDPEYKTTILYQTQFQEINLTYHYFAKTFEKKSHRSLSLIVCIYTIYL